MAKKGKGFTAREQAQLLHAFANEQPLEFVFKLEGRVEDLEVFDLVQKIESMKVALQEANRTVNPNSPDVRVAVRPIQAGSYEIHYALSYLPESLPIVAAAAGGGITTIAQISKVLGDLGVIKKAGVGVLDAINKLRGKPTEVKQVKPNVYSVKSEKGAVMVNGDVKNLLQNSVLIENLHLTFQAPANSPGVTDVKTYLASEPVESAVTVTKELAEGIGAFLPDEAEAADAVNANVTNVWLNPHRGPFTGEPGQWWFKKGSGKPFIATIKDTNFLESYGQGEPRLNSEDLLQVDLLERQKIVDGKLSTSYAIMKVTGYRAGAKKQLLPFPKSKRVPVRKKR
jgi:hypothetical protein